MILKKQLIFSIVFLFSSPISWAQLKIGDEAPEIVITEWISNVPQSKDLSGKFVVIDFWATWCAPCLESVPHMNELVKKNESRSNLVFLALTDEKADKVNPLLKRIPFSSIVVSDHTRQTFDDYGVRAIPFCVVVNDENQIQWFGIASALTNEIIDDIMERKAVSLPVKDEHVSSLPEETEKMYTALHNRYVANIQNANLQEYFTMEPPAIYQGRKYTFTREGGKNYPYNEMIIGDGLLQRLSVFLEVADNQILLPDDLAGSFISYCYKSVVNNTKEDVMHAVLQELELKYTVADSIMEVMQLEVADKSLFNTFVSDSGALVSRSSTSNSFVAIDNDRFSKLQQTIQNRLQKAVALKGNKGLFNQKMSITVQTDNMESLMASLKTYGIKTTMVKKKMNIYRFKKKD